MFLLSCYTYFARKLNVVGSILAWAFLCTNNDVIFYLGVVTVGVRNGFSD